jgi:quercetin dioxygenase-like cupin family protein
VDDNRKPVGRHQHEGPAFWFLNGLSFIRVSSEESGGVLALIEDVLPAGRDTPYHVHEREDETFYMLEGEATFLTEGQTIKATAGATIFLPRGIPHGFRADTPSRMLILTTPGGFDRFVREAGEPAQSLTIPPPTQPDFARLTTIAAKYGIGILGPLPG